MQHDCIWMSSKQKGNTEQVDLVSMWSVCGRYVVGMWLVCGRYVVGMWLVSYKAFAYG